MGFNHETTNGIKVMVVAFRRLVRLALVVIAVVYLSLKYKRSLDRYIPKKYTDESDLLTVSLSYHITAGNASFSNEQYIPCSSNCSWESFVSNSHFLASMYHREPVRIDDTDAISEMRTQLQCVPFSFGYSEIQAREVFPDFEFPSCESKIQEATPTIAMDYSTSTFTMTCPNATLGKYIILPTGFLPTSQYVRDDLEDRWEIRDYPGEPVSLNLSEFVYGSCGTAFTSAQFLPKFNPEAFNRTRTIMNNLTPEKSIKPMVILLVTVDSFSRRHFFRKMPATVAWLNEVKKQGEFSLFDFKLHNILGPNSVLNMVPVMSNSSFQYYDEIQQGDVLKRGSLWKVLKDLGYVTLLGFEGCDNHFPEVLGRDLEVDHLTRSFYCAAYQMLKVRMDKKYTQQRCIGTHMSHYYLLNYTLEFLRSYQGVNQFIYLHIDTAHEATGQHAGTLDLDLLHFLNQTFQFSHKNDIVLFLQGDHGMRYLNWYSDIEAYQENKLPVFFLLAKTSFLSRFPTAFDVLWHNTFRLVSKRDLRATILSLSTVPYDISYPVHNDSYLDHDYILFQEKIKDSRSCEETGIPSLHCSCIHFERIDEEIIGFLTENPVADLISATTEEALAVINAKVFTPKSIYAGRVCTHLSLGKVEQAFGSRVTDKMEIIRVEFTVKESVSARFEVLAAIGSARTRFLARGKGKEALQSLIYRKFRTYLRVSFT